MEGFSSLECSLLVSLLLLLPEIPPACQMVSWGNRALPGTAFEVYAALEREVIMLHPVDRNPSVCINVLVDATHGKLLGFLVFDYNKNRIKTDLTLFRGNRCCSYLYWPSKLNVLEFRCWRRFSKNMDKLNQCGSVVWYVYDITVIVCYFIWLPECSTWHLQKNTCYCLLFYVAGTFTKWFRKVGRAIVKAESVTVCLHTDKGFFLCGSSPLHTGEWSMIL